MTKITLIAAAVAMAVSGTALAGSHGGASVKVSGEVDMQYKAGNMVDLTDPTKTVSKTEITNDDVTLNLVGSAPLGNGTTAFAKYSIDGGTSGTGVKADNAKVGLKGSWGTFTMGEISAATAYAEVAGDINGDPSPAMNTAMSFSKSMGAISFTAGLAPENSGDFTTFGAKWSDGTYTVGAGVTDYKTADNKDSLVGVSAKFGDITVGFMTGDIADKAATAAKVSWASGKVSAAFTTATYDDDDANTRIDVAYKLGGGASVSFRNHNEGDSTAADDAKDYSRVMLTLKF